MTTQHSETQNPARTGTPVAPFDYPTAYGFLRGRIQGRIMAIEDSSHPELWFPSRATMATWLEEADHRGRTAK